MRVAILAPNQERCGIARYSRDLHAALSPLIDVDLVPIHPWPPDGERLARLRAADVVHLQHEYSFWGTAFPPPRAYFAGLQRFHRPGRLVITAHTVASAETVIAARGARLKPLVKRLALRLRHELRREIEAGPFLPADHVIVHTAAAAAMLQKRLRSGHPVQHWPMPVQEWSVPASQWGPLSQRYGFHGRRLVTIFGFVTPEKDYRTALRAMARVRKAHPEVLLVIAGGAREKSGEGLLRWMRQVEQRYGAARPARPVLAWEPGFRSLRAEAQPLPPLLAPWCATGYLDEADARAILEQTDVALLPYRSGTGSYAAGAALVSGCALVTSDLPAFADPLPARRFRVGEIQDLADKLNSLLSDGRALAAAAERSRRYAAENSWTRAAERHVALYQEHQERVRRAA